MRDFVVLYSTVLRSVFVLLVRINILLFIIIKTTQRLGPRQCSKSCTTRVSCTWNWANDRHLVLHSEAYMCCRQSYNYSLGCSQLAERDAAAGRVYRPYQPLQMQLQSSGFIWKKKLQILAKQSCSWVSIRQYGALNETSVLMRIILTVLDNLPVFKHVFSSIVRYWSFNLRFPVLVIQLEA